MKVIGITGGIGSGKSHVISYIENTYGAVICQTDFVAHSLQKPGTSCYHKLIETFGMEIVNEDQSINRKVLGAIVFQDDEKLRQLNHIMHPAVKEEVRRLLQEAKEKNSSLFLIESALLREDHYEELCDELWYIYVSPQIRKQRLLASRDLTREKIQQIMETQSSDDGFRQYCHVVIDNNGAFEETIKQIQKVLGRRDSYEVM